MMTTPTILVLGATGRIGGAVVRDLLDRGGRDVRAAYRRDDAAAGLAALGAIPVRLDLEDAASVEAALAGVDRLLLLTGYTVDMLRQSHTVIDAAKRHGVKHIVHIGASGNPTTRVAHWGWHRYIEAMIEREGFGYTHLQPEAFMQNLNAFGWLQGDQLTNLIGDCAWSWVDAGDVAALAASALAEPKRFMNQVWQLGYDRATMADVAHMVGVQQRREIVIVPEDPHVFYADAVAAGADPAYMSCVRDQFILNAAGAILGADTLFDPDLFAEAVGRPPRDWRAFLGLA
ncbi:NmrA family NAD(P)-binding protein (plasmid) [Skermanella mucosa]|uniref:NmrA family NAD(P)-binding protein n=1 Tax=Skermanella mucosa TaxID=1789672 RepID=UPI00192AF022|nr:NmrA family NAD(P)-binding protein [Skermanella mucosa]UEM24550.1 NmrA family NAD(P)-binding protein [Skermanella mucosa]